MLQVNKEITRVYIINAAERENINVTIDRVTSIVGPFHDAHEYFGLFPLKNRGQDKQYELFLKKPLLNHFNEHDQVCCDCCSFYNLYHYSNFFRLYLPSKLLMEATTSKMKFMGG